MTILVFVVVTVAVLAIAAAAVGAVSRRLAAEPPASLFEFDEAVEFVATALPAEAAGRLSYGDVRTVMTAHLDLLGKREDAGFDVVFVDAEVKDVVAARSDVLARNLTPADVDVVLAAEVEYLEAIGALGGKATDESDASEERSGE
jgi:predicted O-methyltransferase YrrM